MTEPTSRPMRVLQVLGTSTGGIGQHVRSLTAGLVQRGCHVVVAGPLETDRLFDFHATRARFVTAEIGVSPGPRDVAVARQVARWIRGADVVHAHGFRAGLVSLSGGAGAGWPFAGVRPASVPLVLSWHNRVLTEGLKGTLMHRVEAALARGATLNLGASDDLVREASAAGGRAELGMVAPPRPAPSSRTREQVRSEVDVDTQPMVLAVGRLHAQKDYPTLLAAMADLQARDPRPVLVVAGDGPEESSLTELARSLDVDVRWLGRRDDVADLMMAADVLALASVWEARALVVQEAMQLGLPVVTTDVGGVTELVGDGAIVVPSGDPSGLARGIEAVLDDPITTGQMVERAKRIAESWPNEAAVVDRMLAAYRDVTGLDVPL